MRSDHVGLMISSMRKARTDLEDLGEQYLEQADTVLDVNLTEVFDDVVAEDLPAHVPAAMRHVQKGSYTSIELLLDDDFLYLAGDEKLNATIHEGIHGLAERDQLDTALRSSGMEHDVAATVDRMIAYEDETTMEGVVQCLTNAFDPNDAGRYFRPAETQRAKAVLAAQGIDLDEELDSMDGSSSDRQYNAGSGMYGADAAYAWAEIYSEVGIDDGERYRIDIYGLDAETLYEEAKGEQQWFDYAGEEPVFNGLRYAS